jgi:VWFA-related protein
VVDTLHSSFANFTRVRNALTKFFQQESSADSQYALMAVGLQIQAIHDSTRDPAVVLAALHGKPFQRMIQDSESSNIAFEAGRFTELVRQYCKSCGCQTVPLDPLEQPLCATRTGMVQSFLTRFGERTFLLNEEFLQQVKRLVTAAASMPTFRTVVFLSDGFNRFPGQELYGILQGSGPNSSRFSFDPRDTLPELEAVLRIASKYNVKFYTLDLRGLYTAASFDGSSLDASHWGSAPQAVDRQTISVAHENTDVLAEFAYQTGGVFFENSNDLLKGIQRAFADSREPYVLTYVPTSKAFDGKYRAIRVQVNGKGLVVNAKAGYWAIQ